MRRWWLAALALALLAALSSCGDDAPGPAPATPAKSLTVTAVPPPPSVAEILAQVAVLRSLPPPSDLKVATVARGDVPALLDGALTGADRKWFGNTTTLYRLLGFLGPDEDYYSVYRAFAGAAVAGVYEPSTKTFYIVTADGKGLADLTLDQKDTAAHELTHALQDAAFDLGKLSRQVQGNLDEGLAFTALVEGDAVTTQELWSKRSWAPGGGVLLYGRAGPVLAGVPAAIERELRFPYTAGVDWVAGLRASGGTAAIDALFRDLPSATSVVLHPELVAKGWRPGTVALPALEQGLGAGWKRESEGTLGEFVLRNFLQGSIRALDAVNATTGWSGDHYAVYTRATESVAVVRLRFASPSERDQFGAALSQWATQNGAKGAGTQALNGGRGFASRAAGGTEMLLAFGSSPALAGTALALAVGG